MSDCSDSHLNNFSKKMYNLNSYHLSTYEEFTSNLILNSSKIQSNLNKKFIKSISCGESHVLLLTQAGMLYSMGSGENGQLGISATKNVDEPTIITSLLNYKILSVSSGRKHNIILASNRDLNLKENKDLENSDSFIMVFGDNSKGQLGIENVPTIEVPLINEFFSDKKVIKIECGLDFSSVMIKSNLSNSIYIFGHIRPSNNPIEKPLKVDEKFYDQEGDIKDFKCSENSLFILFEILGKCKKILFSMYFIN